MKFIKILIFTLYIFGITIILNQESINKIMPIIQTFMSYNKYDELFIDGIKYEKINHRSHTEIVLHIRVNANFLSLSIQNQYKITRDGYRRLHFKFSTIGKENIRYTLELTGGQKHFVYGYRAPEVLIINGKHVTQDILPPNYFLKLEELYKEKSSSGYRKKEIFDYIVRIHKLLTTNGMYTNPTKDKAIILKMAAENFQISEEEAITICKEIYWT